MINWIIRGVQIINYSGHVTEPYSVEEWLFLILITIWLLYEHKIIMKEEN